MVLITLAVVAATPAAAADQFDLICKGAQESVDSLGNRTNVPKTFEMRLDLAAKQYCEDSCSVLGKISEVTERAVIFEQSKSEPTPEGPARWHYVSRETGNFVFATSDYGTLRQFSIKASCDAAPFRGFPKAVTKF
ncbi:MAG TPA: hypothetical protein VHL34_25110 [Rhizomicrobium sp.]|nr:hypothetical protein [Rhizomicrobium sp.]